jgi:hypothetical protein
MRTLIVLSDHPKIQNLLNKIDLNLIFCILQYYNSHIVIGIRCLSLSSKLAMCEFRRRRQSRTLIKW